jgi:DNA-binding MarR family transcriptional regulator
MAVETGEGVYDRGEMARATPTQRKNRAQLLRDVERLWCALSAAVGQFQSRSAAERGLTLGDLQALDVLTREGGVCASYLADECGLTPGAVTGMLNRLERAGVARRSRDTSDARRLVIEAVEDRPGSECLMPPTFRRVAASFSDAELKSIRRFLSESAAALRRDAVTFDDPE